MLKIFFQNPVFAMHTLLLIKDFYFYFCVGILVSLRKYSEAENNQLPNDEMSI